MRWLPLALVACATEPLDRTDSALAPNEVRVTTSAGAWTVLLDPTAAPGTVDNLVGYIDAGFYDGADGSDATILHRVVPGFVVQGGGLTAALKGKPVRASIPYEGDNGRSNLRGTLAMARTDAPDSATSQFFVNLVDNLALDHTPDRAGYTVFGEVIEGLEVVDTIAQLPTSTQAGMDDVPVDPLTIDEVLRSPDID